jgi:hypothetical protein
VARRAERALMSPIACCASLAARRTRSGFAGGCRMVVRVVGDVCARVRSVSFFHLVSKLPIHLMRKNKNLSTIDCFYIILEIRIIVFII